MSIRAEVAAQLARFDEQAWVALANRGLYRRALKDLAGAAPEVTADDDAGVEVTLGERVVRFTTAGPATATCSCPSAVTCQHVITAGLWLAASGTSGADDHAATVPDVDTLHAELMAWDLDALVAYAGLPAVRWAHQFVADLEAPPALTRDGYLAVAFAHPEVVVRYLGGGPGALMLDQSLPHPDRYRVAAVLAWQRGHGVEPPPPPLPRSSGRSGSAASADREASRARLRAAVRDLLTETVRVGVSHLSPSMHERYTTLAVWAQGAEYHRLALLLRRLADEVELMLHRAATADDHRLLEEVTIGYGLVSALDAAATAGRPAPTALVGAARNAYAPVRTLALIGLGGSPWRTGSGYHGLTSVFWEPERERFLTWTDARPTDLPGFDPRVRWSQPGPWSGLGSPATAAGRRVTLTQAQVSAEGRISGVETTGARVEGLDGEALVGSLRVYDDWDDLVEAQRTARRSLVDPPRTADTWAVLRPAAVAPPSFDPATQTLTWPLFDGGGGALPVVVPWADHHAFVVGRLEALSDLPDGTLVVVRLRSAGGRFRAEPVSLVHPGRSLNPVDCLHFDQPPPTSALVQRLRAAGTPDVVLDDEAVDDVRLAVLPGPLVELRDWLERHAERGTAGTRGTLLVEDLAGHHQRLRDIGLRVFPEPDPSLDGADLLLRSLYLAGQVELSLS
jgi:hypothetical protein